MLVINGANCFERCAVDVLNAVSSGSLTSGTTTSLEAEHCESFATGLVRSVPNGETGGMLGHLGINVADLAVAKGYYDVLMPLLGFEEFLSRDDEFAFMPAGGKRGTFIFFYLASDQTEFSRHQPGLQHLAFTVPTRTAVSGVFEAALELGSPALHEPQEFPQYPAPYHAAFWLDPDGIMIEAVCHHDRE